MKTKIPKSNNQEKIIKYISRNEQFERNGGGQFVSTNRAHKNKMKYDRKRDKKSFEKIDYGFSKDFFFIIFCYNF